MLPFEDRSSATERNLPLHSLMQNQRIANYLATTAGSLRENNTQKMLLLKAIREAEGYLELGLATHAITALQRRGKLVYNNSHACYLLGEAFRETSRYQEAIFPLQRSTTLDPSDAHAWLALAWCYKRSHQLFEAIESLEKGLLAAPENPVLLYNLACYWSLANNRPRALSYLSSAIEIDQNFRSLVPDEADFDSLRNDPTFKLLTKMLL